MADQVVRKVVGQIKLQDHSKQPLKKANKGFNLLSKTIGKATKSMVRFGKTTAKVAKGIKNVAKSMGGLTGGLAAGGIVAGIGAIGFSALKASADFEQTKISFETMIGSVKGAESLLKNIEDFSLKTPFEPETLQESAKVMLGFGINAKKVMPLMSAIGDVSGGNAEKMESLTLAFSQATATGKLMGQDLLQMINAGFNPLDTISRQTGKSIGTLKDEMSKGMISAKMLEKAFVGASSKGGRFHKMLERQSESSAGLVSTIKGFRTQILREFGDSAMKALKPLLKVFAAMAQKVALFLKTAKGKEILKRFGDSIERVAKIVTAWIAGGKIQQLIGWMIKLNQMLPILKASFIALGIVLLIVAAPFIVIIAKIALLTLGIAALIKFGPILWNMMKGWATAFWDFVKPFLTLENAITVILGPLGILLKRLGLIKKGLSFFKGLFGGKAATVNVVEKAATAPIQTAKVSNVQKVNDAIITKTGKVIETAPDDNIVATKQDFGTGSTPSFGGGGGVSINSLIENLVITVGSASETKDSIIGAVKDALDELSTSMGADLGIV